MKVIAKIKHYSMKSATAIASVALFAMMVLIMVEVVLRWLFNTSTMISTDFVAYGLGIVFYFGACKSFDEGAFVRMDVLFESYRGKFKKAIIVVFDVLMLVYNSIIWYYFLQLVIFTIEHDSKAMNIYNTRLIYPRGIVFIGITLFCVFLICRLIEDIKAPIEPLSVRQVRKKEAEELEEMLRKEEALAAAGRAKGAEVVQ